VTSDTVSTMDSCLLETDSDETSVVCVGAASEFLVLCCESTDPELSVVLVNMRTIRGVQVNIPEDTSDELELLDVGLCDSNMKFSISRDGGWISTYLPPQCWIADSSFSSMKTCYSWPGRVVAVGSEVEGTRVGQQGLERIVHCLVDCVDAAVTATLAWQYPWIWYYEPCHRGSIVWNLTESQSCCLHARLCAKIHNHGKRTGDLSMELDRSLPCVFLLLQS
jgi:hypothetical protein